MPATTSLVRSATSLRQRLRRKPERRKPKCRLHRLRAVTLQAQRGAVLAHSVDQRAVALAHHALGLGRVDLDLARQRLDLAQQLALLLRVARRANQTLVVGALGALRLLEPLRREPRRRLDALLQRLEAAVDVGRQCQVRIGDARRCAPLVDRQRAPQVSLDGAAARHVRLAEPAPARRQRVAEQRRELGRACHAAHLAHHRLGQLVVVDGACRRRRRRRVRAAAGQQLCGAQTPHELLRERYRAHAVVVEPAHVGLGQRAAQQHLGRDAGRFAQAPVSRQLYHRQLRSRGALRQLRERQVPLDACQRRRAHQRQQCRAQRQQWLMRVKLVQLLFGQRRLFARVALDQRAQHGRQRRHRRRRHRAELLAYAPHALQFVGARQVVQLQVQVLARLDRRQRQLPRRERAHAAQRALKRRRVVADKRHQRAVQRLLERRRPLAARQCAVKRPVTGAPRALGLQLSELSGIGGVDRPRAGQKRAQQVQLRVAPQRVAQADQVRAARATAAVQQSAVVRRGHCRPQTLVRAEQNVVAAVERVALVHNGVERVGLANARIRVGQKRDRLLVVPLHRLTLGAAQSHVGGVQLRRRKDALAVQLVEEERRAERRVAQRTARHSVALDLVPKRRLPQLVPQADDLATRARLRRVRRRRSARRHLVQHDVVEPEQRAHRVEHQQRLARQGAAVGSHSRRRQCGRRHTRRGRRCRAAGRRLRETREDAVVQLQLLRRSGVEAGALRQRRRQLVKRPSVDQALVGRVERVVGRRVDKLGVAHAREQVAVRHRLARLGRSACEQRVVGVERDAHERARDALLHVAINRLGDACVEQRSPADSIRQTRSSRDTARRTCAARRP
jgi:hypothetical protein